MPFVLLAQSMSADWQLEIGQEADNFTKQMMSDLCMLREQLEEVQTRMILEANQSCHCTISKCEVKVFLTPGSSRLAMQTLQNRSLQVSITENFNSLWVGLFTSLKPLVSMLSG